MKFKFMTTRHSGWNTSSPVGHRQIKDWPDPEGETALGGLGGVAAHFQVIRYMPSIHSRRWWDFAALLDK